MNNNQIETSVAYNRKDHLYSQAKQGGLRSRAYFKLEEINKKHRLIRKGNNVLDLGAWPGGWLEYSAKVIGSQGRAVGIDLAEIKDFDSPNIKVFKEDIREEGIIDEALSFAGNKFDTVLSDLSPKLTGIKDVDRLAAIGLAESALWVCSLALRNGGAFAVKVFKNNQTENFFRENRRFFKKFVREELKSTRKTSTEFYLIGLGYNRP